MDVVDASSDDILALFAAFGRHFDSWRSMLKSHSREVLDLKFEEPGEGSFPAVLVTVEDSRVPGPREVRYELSHLGYPEGAGDASMNLGLFLMEATPSEWERLPRPGEPHLLKSRWGVSERATAVLAAEDLSADRGPGQGRAAAWDRLETMGLVVFVGLNRAGEARALMHWQVLGASGVWDPRSELALRWSADPFRPRGADMLGGPVTLHSRGGASGIRKGGFTFAVGRGAKEVSSLVLEAPSGSRAVRGGIGGAFACMWFKSGDPARLRATLDQSEEVIDL